MGHALRLGIFLMARRLPNAYATTIATNEALELGNSGGRVSRTGHATILSTQSLCAKLVELAILPRKPRYFLTPLEGQNLLTWPP